MKKLNNLTLNLFQTTCTNDSNAKRLYTENILIFVRERKNYLLLIETDQLKLCVGHKNCLKLDFKTSFCFFKVNRRRLHKICHFLSLMELCEIIIASVDSELKLRVK